MGAYFGSKYVAYFPEKICESKVVQVDVKPNGASGSSDNLFVPINEHDSIYGLELFDCVDRAKRAVKRHILLATDNKIQTLLWAIENAKQNIELIRMTEEKSRENTERIQIKKESIKTFQDDLKALRMLRREKVSVN